MQWLCRADDSYISDDSFISDEEKYAQERRRFNKTYKVEDFRRSANGIIYTGFKKDDESMRVVVKQISKNTRHIESLLCRLPNEVYFHFKAAEA